MATTRTQSQIQSDINYNNEIISRCSKYGSSNPADYRILIPGGDFSTRIGVILLGDCKLQCATCGNYVSIPASNSMDILASVNNTNNGVTRYSDATGPYVSNQDAYYVTLSTTNPNKTYSFYVRATHNDVIRARGILGHNPGETRNPSAVATYRNELNQAIARDNAVSDFDSLYTTASRATSSSTLSSNISTLNSYLSTIGTNAGTSSSFYTSRSSKMSTLNTKLSTLRRQEAAAEAEIQREAQRNTNANNAASSFDSLYNSISGDITTVTSSNLSSLQSYLNTISSNSSTSDSRYTTRKTKYDTLKREYDAYQIRTSNLSQIRTSITEINTAINNTRNTVLPEMNTRYNNAYNTGRDVYNTVLEKINDLKQYKTYIAENLS